MLLRRDLASHADLTRFRSEAEAAAQLIILALSHF